MRIDFIGNSHLGAMAPMLTRNRGEREVAHYISRTYGTTPAAVMGHDGGVELPWIRLEESSRYGHVVDLRRSDLVVLMGLRFSLVQMVSLWKHFHPVDVEADYASPALGPDLWDAYVDAAFDATDMMRVARRLPADRRARTVAVPQPAPARWAGRREGSAYQIYRRLVGTGDWGRVLSDFRRQMDRLEASGIEVFQQPEATLAAPGFTRDELAKGDPQDTREDSFYSRGDFYHMNNDFADLVAPELYAWLDARIEEN